MKNNSIILKNILLLFCLGITMTSCFKDLSTIDDDSIPYYVIETEEGKTFDINGTTMENVVIKPRVSKVFRGDTIRNVEGEMDYFWTIGLNPYENDTTRMFLCDGKDLNMAIPVPSGSAEYFLSLTSTDKKHGIRIVTDWRLKMSSIYNNGLLIAETEDDGETSDISLVMAPEFSSQLKGAGDPKILRNLFSFNNAGTKLRGAVSLIHNSLINEQSQFTFISENKKSMTRVYPADFSIMDHDQEKFMIPESYFAPSYIGVGYYEGFLVNNGMINLSDWQNNSLYLYAYPLEADAKGYYCKKYFAHANDFYSGSSGTRFIIYDELNGRFLRLPGKFDPIKSLTAFNLNNGGAFDLNNLPNKTCEMAGTIFSGRRLFMLRDKTTKKLEMYIISKTLEPDNGKLATEIIDMSSFPDIDKVIRYVFSTKDETIYYATDKKIYAIIMTGDLYDVQERYSAPEGTIITAMEMMDQFGINYVYKIEIDPDSGKETKRTIPLTNRTLMYATYNENTKVGSITSQYIESLNTSTFSEEYVWTHTGFNKITAIKAVTY